MRGIGTISQLAKTIEKANDYFLKKVHQQVNTALTIRNWLIGFYIYEYEMSGKYRAAYGKLLIKSLSIKLLENGIKSLSERNLYLCKDFYICYPSILQTASAKLFFQGYKDTNNIQGVTLSISNEELKRVNFLINNLSFSHFIELIKKDNALERKFYEEQAIQNNWSVRELKRAIDSMLFSRIALSNNKKEVGNDLKKTLFTANTTTFFHDTYVLEFLGLENKVVYTESDLEGRIINNLQHFLLELGRGFCFEYRQKRITFDNKHYRVDLVFYHRILKCHILLDLKIGEFDHADAGQMNMYLNYYRENETTEGDNSPIGIILCSGKNEALVKYATMGLPQHIFVSKYLINLPSEHDLLRIVREHEQK